MIKLNVLGNVVMATVVYSGEVIGQVYKDESTAYYVYLIECDVLSKRGVLANGSGILTIN